MRRYGTRGLRSRLKGERSFGTLLLVRGSLTTYGVRESLTNAGRKDAQ
jgi:hypothetical protein